MSLPLLKPLLLTVGATSLVFFGGVITLSVQLPEPTSALSVPNLITQNTDMVSPFSSLSSFKTVANPLMQPLPAQMSSFAALTATQATALAKQDAPNSILQATPELINYNGTVAYEVRLDNGITYIDANLGGVLNPVSTSQIDPFTNDYDDDYKDDHHDDDKHRSDKHRSKKHEDKRYKENGRLIATSYKQHDEDEYDD